MANHCDCSKHFWLLMGYLSENLLQVKRKPKTVHSILITRQGFHGVSDEISLYVIRMYYKFSLEND